MTVHAHEEKIRLTIAAFEARYENGYRYLDHCGETIVRIRQLDRRWILGTTAQNMPAGTAMANQDRGLTLGFGSERLNIGVQGECPLSGGEKKVEELGVQGEALYELIMGCIKAPETTRIGIRYRFTAPADSLEDADQFVSRGAKSPMLDAVLKATHSDLRDAALYFVVEDRATGHRRRIAMESQVMQKAGEPPFTGLGTEGDAAVSVDIDTFTRPESGHFQKCNFFIQNSYTRSRTIALELFQWLKQQR